MIRFVPPINDFGWYEFDARSNIDWLNEKWQDAPEIVELQQWLIDNQIKGWIEGRCIGGDCHLTIIANILGDEDAVLFSLAWVN